MKKIPYIVAIVAALALTGCAGGPKPTSRNQTIAERSAQTKAAMSSYTSKATPVGADTVLISDSEASNATKKASLSTMRAALGLGTTADAVFGTVNAAGGTLSSGVANTTQGALILYTDTDPLYYFGITPAASPTAMVSLKAPPAMPIADKSILNFDIDGTGGFTDPATFATPTGSAASMTIDASGFNGNLATTDNTMQEIAQKVDDLVLGGAASISDTAYNATTWDDVVDVAPSKNTVRDMYEALPSITVETIPTNEAGVRVPASAWAIALDTDGDGSLTDETWWTTALGLKLNTSTLDDTKGNGDMNFIWSADKVYDQLALKAPLSSPDLSTPAITGASYPTAVSTSTATGNINIDGVSADHYYFNNGASEATYTPVITSPPASGKERGIVLTVGGGDGVITMTWTNVSFIGTAGAATTTANKYSHYACLIPNTGNAKCKIIAEASDN